MLDVLLFLTGATSEIRKGWVGFFCQIIQVFLNSVLFPQYISMWIFIKKLFLFIFSWFYSICYLFILQNKVFIYRGLEYERIEAFTSRIQTEFPAAQIYAKNTPPPHALIQSDAQCMFKYWLLLFTLWNTVILEIIFENESIILSFWTRTFWLRP